MATLQFLHQIPMQVGEAEICHELPSIIIQGIVHGEQLVVETLFVLFLVQKLCRLVCLVLELKPCK